MSLGRQLTSRSLTGILLSYLYGVGYHLRHHYSEKAPYFGPLHLSLLDVSKELRKVDSEDLEQILHDTMVDETAQKLLSLKTFLVVWENLVDNFGYLSLAHTVAPMLRQVILLPNCQAAQTLDQAV